MPGRGIGLDELMIVNPGTAPVGGLLLGDDGTVYTLVPRGPGLVGLGALGCGGRGDCRCAADPQLRTECRLGALYLGEDGALYEILR